MAKKKNGHKKCGKDKRKEEEKERSDACARMSDAHYDSLIDDDDEEQPGLLGHSSFSELIREPMNNLVGGTYDPD